MLSRGLMQPDYKTAYQVYNELFQIGLPAIPKIRELILQSDWSNHKYKEFTRYLTGLVCLVRDIDEKEGKEIINHILSNNCPTHIKSPLSSIASFNQTDYVKYQLNKIEVFEHTQVKTKCEIKPYIEKWLSFVPSEDLKDLKRIFIVRSKDINSAGNYTPYLFKLTVVWDNNYKPNSLLHKLFLHDIEHTFYHEIGHHVYRHTFGQDPTQEKEANNYARKIAREAHPKLARVAKVLRAIGLRSDSEWFQAIQRHLQ